MCIYRRAMGSGGEHFFPIEPIRTYQNLLAPIKSHQNPARDNAPYENLSEPTRTHYTNPQKHQPQEPILKLSGLTTTMFNYNTVS